MATATFSPLGVVGLYTETPLHCGAESGAGYVDRPIQRERASRYPVIQGSTIKGVLRDELQQRGGLTEAEITDLFGSEDAKIPGKVSFGDGILAAFPVRSSDAPFHWVTCAYALERVLRVLGSPEAVPEPAKATALAAAGGDVLLEELAITKQAQAGLFGPAGAVAHLTALLPPPSGGFAYVHSIFSSHLLVLHGEDFRTLVEGATEVRTRIKLNAWGTTRNLDPDQDEGADQLTPWERQGNLFVEELVPPETLFLAPLRAVGRPAKLETGLKALPVIRLGGNETIGYGVTHLSYRPAAGPTKAKPKKGDDRHAHA